MITTNRALTVVFDQYRVVGIISGIDTDLLVSLVWHKMMEYNGKVPSTSSKTIRQYIQGSKQYLVLSGRVRRIKDMSKAQLADMLRKSRKHYHREQPIG